MTDRSGGIGQSIDLLLHGGTVVTMDDSRRVLEAGTVAIAGDRIVDVGDASLASMPASRRIDCRGKVLLPGFVDGHNHLFQLMARGLGEGLALWPWLCEFMWPFATNINRAEAEIGAALGAAEAAHAGITCIVDNHYAPADVDSTLGVVRAIERVGLRGAVARGMFGTQTEVAKANGLGASLFRYSVDEEIEITAECSRNIPAGSRVGVWPAPINVIYVDQDLVLRSVAQAHDLGTKWHTHCSEAKADPEIYQDAYSIRPIEWLHQSLLLDDRATIAHAIWLDDEEIDHLAKSRTGVCHNPISNQNLASGVAPITRIKGLGGVVALGNDGIGGQRLDPFEAMRQASLLQRVNSLDPTVGSAEDALEMATRGGAEYAGIDAGVLAAGKLADLGVVDVEKLHLVPMHNVVSSLVYSAQSSDVEMTIVGGRVIFENGMCTGIDEKGLIEEAKARSKELIRRAGLDQLLTRYSGAKGTSHPVYRRRSRVK